ncbi:MAG: acyl carrier protein [Proteobacteria bacterium]|nr:acyl carrier protein [Pseudomonadota bacterium]
MFAMQIVMFLQKEFEIVISDSDLKIDNFRNLSAIVDLVRRKRNERATAA